MSLAKALLFGRDRDLSRLVEIFVIISDFCGFLDFFLDLDREIMDFYKYFDRDFSSHPYLFTFCASKLASKWAKSVGNSIFFQKVSTKILIISKTQGYLDLSRFISIVTICLDDLDKNLDTAKSRWKSLDFKNLDREKENSGLDMMDNLDGFQKFVSTRRTFLISISIGLDCRDPQP
jgi:hypothetical protein